MSEYSWIPVFQGLSNWIAGYENNQEQLVQILQEIGVEKGLEDEFADGRRAPLKEIDPFTFFATFMKYGVVKRSELFATLLEKLDLHVPPPTDFNGVPNAQPLKVWLFPYERERSADTVPGLWALYHQMRAGHIDGELFNKTLKIPSTGFAKLTECLFYLSPEKYFPVDAQTKKWLRNQGRELPKENWQSYQELLSWLDNTQSKPYYKISYEAWCENQSSAFSSVIADEYLKTRYPDKRSSTTHLIAYKTDAMRELAFDPGKTPEKKKKIMVFVDAQPTDPDLAGFLAYESDKSRNHHLATHAPTLAQGNAAWAVGISSTEQLMALCDWYENSPEKDLPVMPQKEKSVKQHTSLNQILVGPPGTGKTYSTLERAVSLAEPVWFGEIQKQNLSDEHLREEVKNKYETLCADKRIAFTTFHQSFSYEDFIEGIRAEVAEENQGIKYKIEKGVFKEIADRAAKAVLDKQHVPLPSSFYDVNNANERQNYVLIIDEINRGNISRIFGELITLLEPDKRQGGSDERTVILPYSKQPFTVPDNLYVIGTMNTADKSLAQLDLALRRRFEFIELMPQPELLSAISVFDVNVGEMLTVMNQRIEVLLDRDHTLGHAYFWPLRHAKSEDEKRNLIAQIFANRIIPLLQEYFFADWERIGWVLNDSVKEEEDRFIQTGNIERAIDDLFPESIRNQLNDRRYRINHSAFKNAAAYQGIMPNGGVANS